MPRAAICSRNDSQISAIIRAGLSSQEGAKAACRDTTEGSEAGVSSGQAPSLHLVGLPCHSQVLTPRSKGTTRVPRKTDPISAFREFLLAKDRPHATWPMTTNNADYTSRHLFTAHQGGTLC